MALQSNLKNMILCLFGVCLVCSAILGGIYVLTLDPIAQANEKALKLSIGQVLPEGGEISDAKSASGFEYYENVVDGEVVAYAVKSTSVGFGGPLVLMVGVLPDGTVFNTSVLSHSETPGLGAKCTSDEGFMAQWKGFSGKLSVKKDGGDVDAITASTITSRAYTKAVAAAVDFVLSMTGGGLPEGMEWEETPAYGMEAIESYMEGQENE